jgi:Domain of unknown function (DUF4349)
MGSRTGVLAFRSLMRILVVGGVALGGLAACGATQEVAGPASTRPSAALAPADAARQVGGSFSVAPAAEPPRASPPAAAAPTRPGAAVGESGASPPNAAAAAPAIVTGPAGSAVTTAAATDRPWDRMIVRTAQLAVQVENVEDAIGAVRNIARAGGGFVAASSTKIEKVRVGDAERERASANLTVQVRVDLFDTAIQSMRALGRVESENGASQDVTEEYVDLDSNLRSLRATESAVMTMLEKAQSLPDVLTLQRELAGVRSQIERIEGRKRFLASRSEFSSIAVTLNPLPIAAAPTATPVTTPQWSPLTSAQVGWQASLRIVRAIVDLVVLTIAFSWWLIPFLGLGAYVLLRRSRRPAGTPAPTQP